MLQVLWCWAGHVLSLSQSVAACCPGNSLMRALRTSLSPANWVHTSHTIMFWWQNPITKSFRGKMVLSEWNTSLMKCIGISGRSCWSCFAVSGGEQLPVAGGEQLPVAGAEQLPVAGAEQLPVSGGEQLPVAGGEQLPVAGAEQLPVSGAEQLPVAGGEPLPVSGAEQLPVAGGEQLPVAVVFYVLWPWRSLISSKMFVDPKGSDAAPIWGHCSVPIGSQTWGPSMWGPCQSWPAPLAPHQLLSLCSEALWRHSSIWWTLPEGNTSHPVHCLTSLPEAKRLVSLLYRRGDELKTKSESFLLVESLWSCCRAKAASGSLLLRLVGMHRLSEALLVPSPW